LRGGKRGAAPSQKSGQEAAHVGGRPEGVPWHGRDRGTRQTHAGDHAVVASGRQLA
jgi:hypothetical protein